MTTASPPAATSKPYLRTAVLVVLALTAARLVGLMLSHLDLFFDEAQYWSWSRELAFGYFSKPPLLAWLIAGAEEVCGVSEACIRSPAPIIYCGVSLLAYAIGRTLYDSRSGFWAAILTALGTGTIFSARIISTDVPLVLFWSAALFAYIRLLQDFDWRWASALGGAIGAGLLAKYAMIYFLAGMLLVAVFDLRARALLARREFWLALAAATLIVSPNLYWNAANGFISLRWAGSNVVGGKVAPSLIRGLEFLAAQFAVFGPVVFAVAIAAGSRFGSRLLIPADRLLLGFAIPALFVVTIAAIFVKANANWAATSFVPLAVMAAGMLVRRNLTVLLWVSVALGLATQTAFFVGDVFASRIYIPFLKNHNPYAGTLGWASRGRMIGELAREQGAPTIAGDTRATVASLLYYWRDQPERILAWPTKDLPNFDLTRKLTSGAAGPVLFVSDCAGDQRFRPFYAKVTPLGVYDPSGPAPRTFVAFKLEEPRGELSPLPKCP